MTGRESESGFDESPNGKVVDSAIPRLRSFNVHD